MGVKRHLRGALDRGARSLGVLALYERRMRRGLTLLMHHRVLPDAECAAYPFPSLVLPLSAFREEVRWLASHAHVATAGELVTQLDTTERDRPHVAITFDDGYADNARHAAPVLEEHGLRASFYVATGFVERGGPLWFDRAVRVLAGLDPGRRAELVVRGLDWKTSVPAASVETCIEALKRIGARQRDELLDELDPPGATAPATPECAPMTIDDLRALARRGHEIGSHGVSHTVFTHVEDAELQRELVESRARLESWLERPVTGLCYPNGDHDERVAAAARAAGYSYACGTQSGRNEPGCDRMRLARIDVTRERVCDAGGSFDEVAFRAEIAGWHEALR